MSKRDHEIVEDYRKLFSSWLISPHLHSLEGDWYILEKDGRQPMILQTSERGLVGFRSTGWVFTPLLIYKVDTSKVR